MCLKVSFSKVIFRSLNLLPNTETSCVVVRRGPTADYEEDQRIFVSSLSWEDVDSVALLETFRARKSTRIEYFRARKPLKPEWREFGS